MVEKGHDRSRDYEPAGSFLAGLLFAGSDTRSKSTVFEYFCIKVGHISIHAQQLFSLLLALYST